MDMCTSAPRRRCHCLLLPPFLLRHVFAHRITPIFSITSALSSPIMSKTFSTADVASHNKGTDMYIIVDGDVYDLTKFQDEHPGGKKSKY